jgi:hypothetical protein
MQISPNIPFVAQPIGNISIPIMIFVFVWSFIWTGLALWHSAKRQDKWWFLIFLLVHTLGILEIIYLVFVIKIFALRGSKA